MRYYVSDASHSALVCIRKFLCTFMYMYANARTDTTCGHTNRQKHTQIDKSIHKSTKAYTNRQKHSYDGQGVFKHLHTRHNTTRREILITHREDVTLAWRLRDCSCTHNSSICPCVSVITPCSLFDSLFAVFNLLNAPSHASHVTLINKHLCTCAQGLKWLLTAQICLWSDAFVHSMSPRFSSSRVCIKSNICP